MRYLRIAIIFLAIGVTLARVVLFITKSDFDVAPVINCDKDVIAVKCDDGDEELLRGVTAFDEQDGDLTDKVFVERMYFMVGEKKSRLNFVVIDSDNNVTKLAKDVIYTDYEKPRIYLTSSLVFPVNSVGRLASCFTAEDCFDGDVTNRIRIISNTYNPSEPGSYDMLARVSNSRGDMTEIKFKAYVVPEEYDVTINLKEYLVYTKVGKKLNYKSYLKNDSKNLDVKIDSSDVDINEPGSYSVLYTVKRGDKTVGFTRLIVVVGE